MAVPTKYGANDEQALEALQVAKQLAERRVDESRAEVRALREAVREYAAALHESRAEVRALRGALGDLLAAIDEWVEAGIVILDDDDLRTARALAAEPAS